ncbi:class I SAM-dependent methyltransferase [Qipengyuania qiaonensis]|uniref:Class I SAM-dependent methyltransferase n=1 Tax=Qipengyuania qiaonensis TaxID=2867240 RepID=A0ABS7JA05_9SPHN|nr:class I SAM-dependent methyltransferase [Qipengyuania qiaonensis]MBX7484150.1 class I SAM-dependent methyltransferase [Qipengyuania qiaonensis]
MGWQSKYVTEFPQFARVKRALEIGAGGFTTAIELSNRFHDKHFHGIDFVLSDLALKNLKAAPSNLTVLKHDARDLELFAEGYFDLVYSVAVMEHICELELHLAETYRVLRPGGSYWFWQAPFWSCSLGHHYRHSKVDCPIPDYAHLHMTRDRLEMHIIENGSTPEVAKRAVDFIYDRPDLSRMGRTDTRGIVESSPFEIAEWRDEVDSRYDPVGAARVLANNIYNVPEEDLLYKGAKVHLKKKD